MAEHTGSGRPGAPVDDADELTRLRQELAAARAEQAATAEILRAIASAPTDSQPVLDAIVQSASRLSDSPRVALYIRDGDESRTAATVRDTAGRSP